MKENSKSGYGVGAWVERVELEEKRGREKCRGGSEGRRVEGLEGCRGVRGAEALRWRLSASVAAAIDRWRPECCCVKQNGGGRGHRSGVRPTHLNHPRQPPPRPPTLGGPPAAPRPSSRRLVAPPPHHPATPPPRRSSLPVAVAAPVTLSPRHAPLLPPPATRDPLHEQVSRRSSPLALALALVDRCLPPPPPPSPVLVPFRGRPRVPRSVSAPRMARFVQIFVPFGLPPLPSHAALICA